MTPAEANPDIKRPKTPAAPRHPHSLAVLAFEGWDSGSHAQVKDCFSRASRHAITWVSRPGRAWKWRLRTGAIELVEAARQRGLLDTPPDAILVTSMVAVGDLRALLPQHWNVPLVLYMHENQAAYPFRHTLDIEVARDHQLALTNLTSMLAADRVLWNSSWNQRSFIDAIQDLLAKAPDGQLGTISEVIKARSQIVWPPVEGPPRVLHNSRGDGDSPDDPVRIVWPHRWEHDKGPDTLLRLARWLQRRHPGRHRWIILGERYRKIPPAMEAFLAEFDSLIDHAGYVDSRAEYWSLLAKGDWVLSTARHEFFGIAVVEAMLAGCLPWLPQRLSYPELIPPELARLRGRYHLSRPTNGQRATALEAIHQHLEGCRQDVAADRIDTLLESLCGVRAPQDPSPPLRR